MQSSASSQNLDVFESICALKIAESIPVGMVGKMYRALDRMRAAGAPSQQVATAEQFSVAVRMLEAARRKCDKAAEQVIMDRLDALATDWKLFQSPAKTAQDGVSN